MNRLDHSLADAIAPTADNEVIAEPVGVRAPDLSVGLVAGFAALTMLALFLRMLTLETYVGHVDEPASLLAISRTADLGYPLFPSGVLYLQGSVFSYLAAPLTWVFEGEPLLHASRVLYLLLALAVVPLSMALVFVLSGSQPAAMLGGVFVALDPALMIWGVSIRPYGLLIVEVVLLALLFTLVIRDGSRARCAGVPIVVLFPVVFGIGTFTHIGIWLLLPPLFVASWSIWRGSLLRENRAILLSVAACVLPLLAFIVLGQTVGTGSGTATNQAGRTFVGSHLFSWRQFLEMPGPRFDLWTDNFRSGVLHWATPLALGFASTGLLIWYRGRRQRGEADWRTSAVLALLALHWMTVLEVVFLVDMDPDPRYLVHVVSLGYVIVAVAVGCLLRTVILATRARIPSFRAGLFRMATVALCGVIVAATLSYVAMGAQWRIGFAGSGPDYWGATQWAAEHAEPDRLLLTALPPAAWFWFDPVDVAFLAGPEGSNRALRYTKQNQAGEPGDYWLGVPSVQSVGQLCTVLADPSRQVLVVVDRGRLRAEWGFLGDMRDIIVGATTGEHTAANGTLVLSVVPTSEWTAEARALCGLESG